MLRKILRFLFEFVVVLIAVFAFFHIVFTLIVCLLSDSGVSRPTGRIDGHAYVDLGLPSGLKWATKNVGALTINNSGKDFPWDEITTEKTGDIVTERWGENWRMPTKEDYQELIYKCRWEWVTRFGKRGCTVTGPNGRRIFLPDKASLWIWFKYSNDFSDLTDPWRHEPSYGLSSTYWSSIPDTKQTMSLSISPWGHEEWYSDSDEVGSGLIRPVAE